MNIGASASGPLSRRPPQDKTDRIQTLILPAETIYYIWALTEGYNSITTDSDPPYVNFIPMA